MEDELRRFCPKCGRKVEVIAVSLGTEGIERLRCSNCGAFLDEGGDRDSFREAVISGDESLEFSDESIVIPTYHTILLVGYRPEVSNLIAEGIGKKNLAREVISCENGEEMIIKLIPDLESSDGNKINLAIMDVPMPYLNGINAGIGLRAIEKAYPNHQLIPILFLTRKPMDETFKKVIKYLAPAKYAGLGPSDNPKELAPRLNRIIALLAQESW